MSGKLERFARDLQRRASRLELPQVVSETFGEYRNAPVRFCKDVLGVTSATRRSDGTPYQWEILESVAAESRVSVRSGHGIGKSTLYAWAALWWLCSRPLSKCVIVAPEFLSTIPVEELLARISG